MSLTAQVSAENESVQTELTELGERYDVLHKEHIELQTEVQKLKQENQQLSEVHESQVVADDLERKNQELSETVRKQEAIIGKLRSDNESLSNQIQIDSQLTKHQIDTVTLDCESLKSQLRQNEKIAKQEIQKITSECRDLRAQIADSETAHQHKVHNLKAELVKCQLSERAAKEQLQELTTESESIRAELAQAQQQQRRSLRRIAKLTERNEELETFVDSCDINGKLQQTEELTAQIAKQTNVIRDLHSELEDQTDSNERLQHEAAKLRIKIAELTDLNTALKVKAGAVDAENKDLKQELQNRAAEAEFNVRKGSIEVKTLTDELKNVRAENQKLTEQINGSRGRQRFWR
jgi:chromosome segregation ATPase